MARSLRIQYEGAIYHVFSRGHRADRIFKNEGDKKKFLEKLIEVIEKYHIDIHCYVLMNTHYHLLISTPYANLSRAMHQLNTSYSNWFKAKYKLIGSLFQGRFKSILVEAEDYMIVLSAYIHLNPVRSGQVKRPEEYIWSSFRAYTTGEGIDTKDGRVTLKRGLPSSYLCTDNLLEMFSGNRESYRSYVYSWLNREGDMDKEEIYGKYTVIGSDEFRKGILSQIGFSASPSELREKPELINLKRFKADEIRNIIMRIFGVSEDEVYSKKRGNVYRKLYLFALRCHSNLSLKEIGDLFKMDYSAVSKEVCRFIQASKHERDEKLGSMVEKLKKKLRRY